VRAVLAGLRRRIRRYLWIQGLASIVACLGLVFWVSLTIDWFFEPPRAVRWAMLAAAAVALTWVHVKMMARRAFVQLSDRSMALVLERYFPQFDESLITAVELTDRADPSADCDTAMLAETCRLAAASTDEVRFGKIFNARPLQTSVAAAVCLTGMIGFLAARSPETLDLWARRSFLMSNDLWPRKTRLVVEGFEGGTAKVARGADLTVIAKADLQKPLVPAVVRVRYRTAGGRRQQQTMDREGTVDPAKDRFQEYSYTFRGVLAPVELDVFGGDDAVRGLRIEVVDNPTLLKVELDCRFPEYMDREPSSLPVVGVMPVPIGTEVTLRATAN